MLKVQLHGSSLERETSWVCGVAVLHCASQTVPYSGCREVFIPPTRMLDDTGRGLYRYKLVIPAS